MVTYLKHRFSHVKAQTVFILHYQNFKNPHFQISLTKWFHIHYEKTGFRPMRTTDGADMLQI